MTIHNCVLNALLLLCIAWPVAWALGQTPPAPISTSAACSSELVALRTADGVRLQGIVFRASKLRPSALLLVHGYGGTFYRASSAKLGEAPARACYHQLSVTSRDQS